MCCVDLQIEVKEARSVVQRQFSALHATLGVTAQGQLLDNSTEGLNSNTTRLKQELVNSDAGITCLILLGSVPVRTRNLCHMFPAYESGRL
ncbi:hypothetical protein scyTo_0014928 [Scyliorhinus torazame]|uniref:Uncharacterized protein n=1 Tax=Scyliorhinus torazame TaxID=75743 RepID=A0A401NY99_SCYTO|nr:hypothetical protein [Scyliorhinus torazame]